MRDPYPGNRSVWSSSRNALLPGSSRVPPLRSTEEVRSTPTTAPRAARAPLAEGAPQGGRAPQAAHIDQGSEEIGREAPAGRSRGRASRPVGVLVAANRTTLAVGLLIGLLGFGVAGRALAAPVVRISFARPRIAAFAWSVDGARSEAAAGTVQAWIREGLRRSHKVRMIRTHDLLDRAYARETRQRLRRARNFLVLAKKSYRKLDLRRALGELTLGLRDVAPSTHTAQGLATYVETLKMLAAVKYHLGKSAEAREFFVEALMNAPNTELGKTLYTPPLRSLFAKAQRRAAYRLRGHGSLEVASVPAGASVILDGKLRGTSPLLLPKVRSGPHRLVLMLDGYRIHARIVRIREKRRTAIGPSLVGLGQLADLHTAVGNAVAAHMGKGVGLSVRTLSKMLEADQLIIARVKVMKGRVGVRAILYDLRDRTKTPVIRALLDPASPTYHGEMRGLAVRLLSLAAVGRTRVTCVSHAQCPERWKCDRLKGFCVPLPPPRKKSKKRVWLWVAIGTLAAGAVVTTLVLALPKKEPTPTTGIIVFRY